MRVQETHLLLTGLALPWGWEFEGCAPHPENADAYVFWFWRPLSALSFWERVRAFFKRAKRQECRITVCGSLLQQPWTVIRHEICERLPE